MSSWGGGRICVGGLWCEKFRASSRLSCLESLKDIFSSSIRCDLTQDEPVIVEEPDENPHPRKVLPKRWFIIFTRSEHSKKYWLLAPI